LIRFKGPADTHPSLFEANEELHEQHTKAKIVDPNIVEPDEPQICQLAMFTPMYRDSPSTLLCNDHYSRNWDSRLTNDGFFFLIPNEDMDMFDSFRREFSFEGLFFIGNALRYFLLISDYLPDTPIWTHSSLPICILSGEMKSDYEDWRHRTSFVVVEQSRYND